MEIQGRGRAIAEGQVYRPRRPRESPLWRCLCAHFYDFIQAYPEKYEKNYGFLKPVVEDVVDKGGMPLTPVPATSCGSTKTRVHGPIAEGIGPVHDKVHECS